MSPSKEAAIWRRIGKLFERRAVNGAPGGAGLCYQAAVHGLPAYAETGRRIDAADYHEDASHRALTAYLLAEMVADGLAPHYD